MATVRVAAGANLPGALSTSGSQARRTLVPLKVCASPRHGQLLHQYGNATIRSSYSVTANAPPGEKSNRDDLALKEIPGSYGLPFFGAIKDRLDFNIFQQMPGFYTHRKDKYNSTVYRTNVAPGPPFFPDPRVIVLLDGKSYPILFDTSKVSKKDVFFGTYMPSLKLFSGYRVLPLLDPSEPKHEKLKTFAFEILKGSAPRILPEIAASMSGVLSDWESTIKEKGKVSFGSGLDTASFQFMVKSFIGRDPYESGENSIGTSGASKSLVWVFAQIGPITVVPGLPWIITPLIELLLHTLPIPTIVGRIPYNALVKFFRTYSGDLLDYAEKELGLEREEALHNLIYTAIFNAWAGLKLLLPFVIQELGMTSPEYQKELSAEVTQAVEANGGKMDFKSLGSMPMVESAVFEVLRLHPPVPYQYAKAKEDFIIESHDAAFQIKKGEVLAGYCPLAMKDPNYFEDPDSFQPKRFMGEKGQALLKYHLWSNGPQTAEATVNNKQCPGWNFIPKITAAVVANIYATYETIQVDAKDQTSLTGLRRRQTTV